MKQALASLWTMDYGRLGMASRGKTLKINNNSKKYFLKLFLKRSSADAEKPARRT